MKWKSVFLIGGLILIIVSLVATTFLMTGGVGLVKLYKNYLSQDLPEKKYSRIDFTDHGPRENLSGYYAGTIGDSVYIWTLSGLKRFTHKAGTSVYYYIDTCQVIRVLSEAREDNEKNGVETKRVTQPQRTFNLWEWAELVHRADYVWVMRVGEGDERTVIDKIYATSNQDYPIEKLKLEQCQK